VTNRKGVYKLKKTWRDIRESMNLTQADMARKLGMSRQLYQMKECGRRQFKLDEAIAISKMSGVDLKDVQIVRKFF